MKLISTEKIVTKYNIILDREELQLIHDIVGNTSNWSRDKDFGQGAGILGEALYFGMGRILDGKE